MNFGNVFTQEVVETGLAGSKRYCTKIKQILKDVGWDVFTNLPQGIQWPGMLEVQVEWTCTRIIHSP